MRGRTGGNDAPIRFRTPVSARLRHPLRIVAAALGPVGAIAHVPWWPR